jgi:hypothetical protein
LVVAFTKLESDFAVRWAFTTFEREELSGVKPSKGLSSLTVCRDQVGHKGVVFSFRPGVERDYGRWLLLHGARLECRLSVVKLASIVRWTASCPSGLPLHADDDVHSDQLVHDVIDVRVVLAFPEPDYCFQVFGSLARLPFKKLPPSVGVQNGGAGVDHQFGYSVVFSGVSVGSKLQTSSGFVVFIKQRYDADLALLNWPGVRVRFTGSVTFANASP